MDNVRPVNNFIADAESFQRVNRPRYDNDGRPEREYLSSLCKSCAPREKQTTPGTKKKKKKKKQSKKENRKMKNKKSHPGGSRMEQMLFKIEFPRDKSRRSRCPETEFV